MNAAFQLFVWLLIIFPPRVFIPRVAGVRVGGRVRAEFRFPNGREKLTTGGIKRLRPPAGSLSLSLSPSIRPPRLGPALGLIPDANHTAAIILGASINRLATVFLSAAIY